MSCPGNSARTPSLRSQAEPHLCHDSDRGEGGGGEERGGREDSLIKTFRSSVGW